MLSSFFFGRIIWSAFNRCLYDIGPVHFKKGDNCYHLHHVHILFSAIFMRKVYESIYSSMRKRTGTIAFLCRIMKKHGMDWHTRYNIQACLRNDKKRIKRILTVVFESWPTTITSTGIPQWHVTIPLMAEIKEQLLLLQKFGVLFFRNSCHILIYNFSYYIFKNRYYICSNIYLSLLVHDKHSNFFDVVCTFWIKFNNMNIRTSVNV